MHVCQSESMVSAVARAARAMVGFFWVQQLSDGRVPLLASASERSRGIHGALLGPPRHVSM